MDFPLPIPAERALQKLGADLSLARRRRKLTQAMLAERLGTSVATIRRMEAGHPGIAWHLLARALQVFGELDRLHALLDTAQDDIGLVLMNQQVPQRVRKAKPGSNAF